MHKLFLAICIRLQAWLNKLINNLKTIIQEMETELKSGVAGLTKIATLQSFSIDANGNFTLVVTHTYKDAEGNVLTYNDPSKAGATIALTLPDPSVDPTTYTSDQARAVAQAQAVLTALAPVIKTIIPEAV